VGRAGAKAVGYPDAELDRLPPEALASFAGVGDRGLWGVVAVVGALAACYGTMALLALLSLLGISITLDPGLWAATIVGAAILAVVATAFNLTRHRQHGRSSLPASARQPSGTRCLAPTTRWLKGSDLRP
jgi:hypothetical protein